MNSSLDKTDRMASENPASADGNVPTGSKMTTLCIKKGASVNVLKTHDPIEFGDDVKTTTQLRTILVGKGVMVEGDQFVGKDGSLLKRDLEGSTQWSDLVAEEAVRIICSNTADDTAPATGDVVPTTGDTVPATGDTVPATGDTVPANGGTVLVTENTVQATADAGHATGNTSGADSTPASGAGNEATAQLQERVTRSKTEVIEEVLTKTGTIVQRKFSQGMHEAGVVVEKVVTYAGSSRAKVAESVAAQKARLQNSTLARTSSAIQNFGGIALGEGGSADATVAQGSAARKRLSNMFPGAPKEEAVSGDANVEQRRSARTKVATALASPQEDTPKKVDVVEATSARPDPTGVQPVPPQGVPQNVTVDFGLPNPIDEPHREDSLNINISPVTLPNLADAQFDSPREEVPMPSNLMDFTQEHWDVMCHNNNIFKGVRMEDSGPNPSIADLIEPLTMSDIHYALNDKARTEYTTTYTERNSKYANHGWTTKALLLTIPWVDSSITAEQDELRASSKDVKTIYTSVFQRYPFVTVGIKRQSLRPSADFKNAITDALAQPKHKRRDALDKVFGTYGHAFQMEFDLGALMVKTSSTTTSNEMSQEKWEQKVGFEFKAVLSKLPVPPYIKAGGLAEKGKTEDDFKVDYDADKLQTYELRGGNARLSAGAWIQTIADYPTWRVIRTSEVIPVVDILPADLQKEIDAITPLAEKPTKPLTGKWVDAVEHVINTKDEIDAKWLKLHRAETGSTGDWFWLGQSLDKNKALMVKENEPGALGLLAKPIKIWDNEGADTREKQAIWDFYPANPEKYVSLGSYFQMAHRNKPEPPPSFKAEYLKCLRAVRKDLLVDATLGERTYWDNDTGGTATSKVSMWEVVQELEEEKEETPEALETHLFKAFRGVPTQREDHCERSVFLIKKSAIEIIDGDYQAPAHKHTFVGETRVIDPGCLRGCGRSCYHVVKDWFR